MGGSQPHTNFQPYLCVDFIISLFGIFPFADLRREPMADPFVAEIRIFPFNFAPRGWAWCDGQLLPLSQNTALFSLLGTTYGGNGRVNFALPDLQGRAPMHPGQGPGLSLHDLGETGGTRDRHPARERDPVPQPRAACRLGRRRASRLPRPRACWGAPPTAYLYQNSTSASSADVRNALAPAGGDQPHNNLQPYLTSTSTSRCRGSIRRGPEPRGREGSPGRCRKMAPPFSFQVKTAS